MNSQVAVPSLQTAAVALRPVSQSDYARLHALEMEPPLGPTWRFRGSTPTAERWSRTALADTLAQFLVVATGAGDEVGLVLVHQPDFQDGHAHISATHLGHQAETDRSPLLIVGLALLVRYTFSCWNFRKLYMEAAEYTYHRFASGAASYFEVEGRLKDHYYLGDRYWDKLVLAIYRSTWQERGAAMLRLAER